MRFHAFARENGEMFFVNGGWPESDAVAYGEEQGAVTYLGLVEVKITFVQKPVAPQKNL